MLIGGGEGGGGVDMLIKQVKQNLGNLNLDLTVVH